MNRALPHRRLLSLLLAALLLAACATSSPAHRAWEGAGPDDTTSCDEPNADQCVVLACDEGECAFFDCEDVDPEALAHVPLAHGAELAQFHRPPSRGPGISATGDARDFEKAPGPG